MSSRRSRSSASATLSLAVDGVNGCTVTVGSWSDAIAQSLMLGNDNVGIHPEFQGTMSDA